MSENPGTTTQINTIPTLLLMSPEQQLSYNFPACAVTKRHFAHMVQRQQLNLEGFTIMELNIERQFKCGGFEIGRAHV